MSSEIPKELPQKIKEEEKQLLEELIGTQSWRHRELYLRSTWDGVERQAELWYLAPIAILNDRETAIKELSEAHLLTEREATAAYLFCNAFPETVKDLNRRHSDWPEEKRVAQDNPFEVLDLKP